MKTAVLISSHDKYSFAWDGCAHGFKKYWPDCPWPIYFMTNTLTPPLGIPIFIRDTQDWSTSMKIALLTLIDEKFESILFILEDFWLTASTNTKALEEFAHWIEGSHLGYIKLYPSADATVICPYEPRIAYFKPDALYRTSLNASLWNPAYFLALLKENESIWAFETEAGRRATTLGYLPGNFCAVTSCDYIHYIYPDDSKFSWKDPGAVTQGKLTDSAKEYMKLEGLQ